MIRLFLPLFLLLAGGTEAHSSRTSSAFSPLLVARTRPLAELEATNSLPWLRQWYVWGADESGTLDGAGGVGGLVSVSKFTADGWTWFTPTDGRGNVAALVDYTAGEVQGLMEYSPFGEVLRSSGRTADALPLRFSTKYEDAETGFVYFGGRHYEPVTGRWTSHDPIGEAGGLNLYGFVGNDPVDYFDSDGRRVGGFIRHDDGTYEPYFEFPGEPGSRFTRWREYFDIFTSWQPCKDSFDLRFERVLSEEATSSFPYGSLSASEILEAVDRGYLSQGDLPPGTFGDSSEPYTPTKARVMPTDLNVGTASRLRTLLKSKQSSPTQTQHPNSLPASCCCPGQLRSVVLRVCFTSARPVRPRSWMRLPGYGGALVGT